MRKYFYIGKRLALELNGAQTRSIFYGMECVLSELETDELSISTLLLAANRENSVQKANITRSYSAYGFDDLTARESLIGFNGEARDGVVGCDLLGNGRRAYSPVLMRFLSPDIMSPFEEGGLNAYMYCEGDPINYSDPSAMGKWPSNNPSPSRPMVPKGSKSNTISRNRLPQQSRTAVPGGSDGSPSSSSPAKRRPDAPAVPTQFWEEANDTLKVERELTSQSLAQFMVREYNKGRVNRHRGVPAERLIAAIEFKIRTRGADFSIDNGWNFGRLAQYHSARSERTGLIQAIQRVVNTMAIKYPAPVSQIRAI